MLSPDGGEKSTLCCLLSLSYLFFVVVWFGLALISFQDNCQQPTERASAQSASPTDAQVLSTLLDGPAVCQHVCMGYRET